MTRYTDDVRAEFEGLARMIGTEPAMERMAIPRTTAYRWMRRPLPIVSEMQTPKQVVDALWETMQLGITEVQRRMRDPKARLSDVAQALRVVAEQHALLTGGATARSETTNVNVEVSPNRLTHEEQKELDAWLHAVEAASDEDLAAGMPTLLPQIRAMRELEANPQLLTETRQRLLGDGTEAEGVG